MYSDISEVLKEKGIDQFSEDYSIYTAEVEEMIEHGKNDLIVVGKILSAEKHPDADKLSVVQVDTGTHGKHQIVCGAPNVLEAEYVPVALEGCQLAPEFVIGKRSLKGIDSCGMICSEDELGLQPDRSPGILILDKAFPDVDLESMLGTPFHELTLSLPLPDGSSGAYPVSDIVMDLDNKFITNRPDLFGVYGNAREAYAIFEKELKTYSEPHVFGSGEQIPCTIDSELTQTYTLVRYDDVVVSDSPLVIKTLLNRAGMGVKNNAVDLTNLISTELAQPMHAMDADKIVGDIVVREARDGEQFIGLDDNEYELAAGDIVIADDEKVLDLGGIMGAANCAVTSETKNIIVEAATFDAQQIRKTASRLGIRTDASMRFEKSQDPTNPARAQSRFAQLLGFCGYTGSLSSDYLFERGAENISITTTWSFIKKRAGRDFETDDMRGNLEKLGFVLTSDDGDKIQVSVPSWRATKDVDIPEDIVEEVARLHDYNTFDTRPVPDAIDTSEAEPVYTLDDKLSDYFAGRGLYDPYTYTFTSPQRNAYFQDKENSFEVLHPFSEEQGIMRASIFDSLLTLLADHQRTHDRCGFFESGMVFGKDIEGFQRRVHAGVVLRYAKEDIAGILSGLIESYLPGINYHLEQGSVDELARITHPNKSAVFKDDKGNELISYGYLHPSLADHVGLNANEVIAFQILSPQSFAEGCVDFESLERFPAIDREINFVMDQKVTVGSVCEDIKTVSNLVTDVSVVEVYEDASKLGEGKKSVLFSCRLVDRTKTLTDEEALQVQESIISHLKQKEIVLRA